MLDVMMPVSVKDIPLAVTESGDQFVGSIPQLVEKTDVPFRMVVQVDGGIRPDVELLERYMPAMAQEWTLSQSNGVKGYAATLSEMLDGARNEFVAIVPPNIWIEDEKWFGKMQVVFTKDPHCFMVAADVPNTAASTMPPFKLDHRRHPPSQFFLTRRAAILNVGMPLLAEDVAEEFSRSALALGGTRWIAGGVRFGDAHARETTGAIGDSQGSDS